MPPTKIPFAVPSIGLCRVKAVGLLKEQRSEHACFRKALPSTTNLQKNIIVLVKVIFSKIILLLKL
jgi:hypothetical protein